MPQTAAPAAEEAVIKVSGALKGVVRIQSFQATVGELRAEVARLLGEACRQQQLLCMTCAVRDMLTAAAPACTHLVTINAAKCPRFTVLCAQTRC
jgi:hypothetical protein